MLSIVGKNACDVCLSENYLKDWGKGEGDAHNFKMMAGMRSSPVDLLVSSVSSNFFMPLVVMSRGGMCE